MKNISKTFIDVENKQLSFIIISTDILVRTYSISFITNNILESITGNIRLPIGNRIFYNKLKILIQIKC